MPVCTLHLVSLKCDLEEFLSQLLSASPHPLVISRVIRWIIKPTTLSVQPFLTQQQPPWHLLLIYPNDTGLPESLHSLIDATFTLHAGVPSSIVSNFQETNGKLLHPQRSDVSVPALTGALDNPRIASSAQSLELTAELSEWIKTWDPEQTKGAVSMLNLLAFKPGMHAEYLKYGKAFAESIGSRRGGNAKIVGKVIDPGSSRGDGSKPEAKSESESGWEEIALAHYPSIWHFADMAASEDYQKVNKKHRVGSLRDTCILMTSELDLPSLAASAATGVGARSAKL